MKLPEHSGETVEDLLQLGQEANIFATYGLSRNPFPSHELPEVTDIASYVRNVCITVREKELKEIKEKFLEIAFGPGDQPGQPINLWVHGELGVGKSAIIIFLYNLLKEHKSDIVVPLYIVSPGNGIDDIYEGTIRLLGGTFFEILAQKLFAKVIEANKELIHSDNPEKVFADIKNDPSILAALIQKEVLDLNELAQKTKSYLSEGHLYVDDKMISYVLNMITMYEKSWEGIKQYTKRDRLDGLVTLFYLFSQAGFKMSFLFIDQLEYSWRIWTKTKRNRFVMDTRELVQRSIPYLSVLCTSNADLTEDIEVNYPTFLRPLPMDPARVVVVRKLTKVQMRSLVEFYLDLARVSKKSPEFYPFTESSIDVIYEQTEGVTGHFLIACFGLLNYAARRGYKLIDEKVVKEYFAEGKPIEEKVEPVAETKISEEDILR